MTRGVVQGTKPQDEVEYFPTYSHDIFLDEPTIPSSELKSANHQENPDEDIREETVKFL